MSDITCLRCGGALELGYVLDEGYGTRTPALWIEGPPEPSAWSGLKTSDRRRLPIDTWRCETCGLLEQYAPA